MHLQKQEAAINWTCWQLPVIHMCVFTVDAVREVCLIWKSACVLLYCSILFGTEIGKSVIKGYKGIHDSWRGTWKFTLRSGTLTARGLDTLSSSVAHLNLAQQKTNNTHHTHQISAKHSYWQNCLLLLSFRQSRLDCFRSCVMRVGVAAVMQCLYTCSTDTSFRAQFIYSCLVCWYERWKDLWDDSVHTSFPVAIKYILYSNVSQTFFSCSLSKNAYQFSINCCS